MPVGTRLQSALIQPHYQREFENINDEAFYRIVLPDCLSHGSDGYSMFPDYSTSNFEIGKNCSFKIYQML